MVNLTRPSLADVRLQPGAAPFEVDFTAPERVALPAASGSFPPEESSISNRRLVSTAEQPATFPEVSMADLPALYNIEARQGDTWTRVFTWSVDGSPVDLTGRTARMEVRTKPSATTATLNATPYITLGGNAGTVTVSIPASVLAAIEPRTGSKFYVYDLEIVTGQQVTTLLAGRFTVAPEVTKVS